jgi:cytochrome c551/c552
MANRPEAKGESPKRPLIPLLASVVLLGTVLAWWGTRDHRHLFGEPSRNPVAAVAADTLQNIQTNDATLDRGSQVAEHDCAGCHQMTGRSIGPSYEEIVTLYQIQAAPSDGTPELLSRLATAVTHPQPGWTNFAPGPAESGLALEDRVAVASWILKDCVQRKDVHAGTRK